MLLDRYIARHVLAGIAIVLTFLAALFFIRDLIIDLDDVGRGEFGYLAALQFVVMRLPGRIYALLPAAVLIGGLLGLGWLARGGELTAMRAAGTSVARLLRAVMQAGAIVIGAGLLLGEWFAPWTERSAHDWRIAAITGQIGFRTGSGFWGRDATRFFRIGEVLPDGQLRDLRMFEFDAQGRLAVAWRAREAASVAGERAPGNPDGSRESAWELEEVGITRFREEGVETERTGPMRRQLPASAGELRLLAARPEWLRLPALVAYTRHLRENGLGTAPYDAVLWSRVMAPFLAAAMLFTSVALILGPLGRTTFGVRIVTGIGFGIGFYIVQKVVVQLGLLYDWLAPFAAAAPVAALGALGWWWLRRAV